MWFSVVCTLIDNDMCHHSGQNLLWTHSAVPHESGTFWPLWWHVSLSTRVQTTLNCIRFVNCMLWQQWWLSVDFEQSFEWWCQQVASICDHESRMAMDILFKTHRVEGPVYRWQFCNPTIKDQESLKSHLSDMYVVVIPCYADAKQSVLEIWVVLFVFFPSW